MLCVIPGEGIHYLIHWSGVVGYVGTWFSGMSEIHTIGLAWDILSTKVWRLAHGPGVLQRTYNSIVSNRSPVSQYNRQTIMKYTILNLVFTQKNIQFIK